VLATYETTTGRKRALINDENRNIEFAFAPRGLDGKVVVAEVSDARLYASLFDTRTGEEEPLSIGRGSILPLRPLDNGEWVARLYSSTQPMDLVRYNPETGATTSLTGLWDRTTLTPDQFIPAEDFRWVSQDSLEIQGWLYRAKEPAAGTVVLVHGGPTHHTEDAFNVEVQYLVSQGLNILEPNYRGSTGFSLEFQESIKQDGWGGREQEDIRAGIDALIDAGIAQHGKVGITGTSYGGYSSWHAITHWGTNIVAASAPICGMTDLVVDYETTRPDLRPYSEEMMGGTPEQQPAKYRNRSPINFVNEIEGKLLIVQGMRDPNVTPDNVSTVRTALDNAAIPYDVLAFDDEGHGISKPENQRVLYQRLAEFFKEAFSS
jgi:dipeptidyl aminopeptidase/acylaminoacyl peptidase